jgi:hypothetical protein
MKKHAVVGLFLKSRSNSDASSLCFDAISKYNLSTVSSGININRNGKNATNGDILPNR